MKHKINIKDPIDALKYIGWKADDLLRELRNDGYTLEIYNENTGYIMTLQCRNEDTLIVRMRDGKIEKIF